MHFLSQMTTGFATHPVLLATTVADSAQIETSPLANMASLIVEFGVQVIIVAMMMVFMWRYMNNVIKRDNKLFENVAPQLETITKSIAEMDTNVSSLISSHNAHMNQSIHALEKDQEDIRSILIMEQDQLRSIAGQLTVLNSNVEVMFHHIIALSAGGYTGRMRQLQSYPSENLIPNGDRTNDHYNIHPNEEAIEEKK